MRWASLSVVGPAGLLRKPFFARKYPGVQANLSHRMAGVVGHVRAVVDVVFGQLRTIERPIRTIAI